MADHPRYSPPKVDKVELHRKRIAELDRQLAQVEPLAAHEDLIDLARGQLGLTGTDDDVLDVVLHLHRAGKLSVEQTAEGQPYFALATGGGDV